MLDIDCFAYLKLSRRLALASSIGRSLLNSSHYTFTYFSTLFEMVEAFQVNLQLPTRVFS